MKKTIVMSTGANGSPCALEQVMKAALAYGFVISKRTLMFNSKKEAHETMKAHTCGRGLTYYTLNDKQVQILTELKEKGSPLYIQIWRFLSLK